MNDSLFSYSEISTTQSRIISANSIYIRRGSKINRHFLHNAKWRPNQTKVNLKLLVRLYSLYNNKPTHFLKECKCPRELIFQLTMLEQTLTAYPT